MGAYIADGVLGKDCYWAGPDSYIQAVVKDRPIPFCLASGSRQPHNSFTFCLYVWGKVFFDRLKPRFRVILWNISLRVYMIIIRPLDIRRRYVPIFTNFVLEGIIRIALSWATCMSGAGEEPLTYPKRKVNDQYSFDCSTTDIYIYGGIVYIRWHWHLESVAITWPQVINNFYFQKFKREKKERKKKEEGWRSKW